jgi:hypothetical protein
LGTKQGQGRKKKPMLMKEKATRGRFRSIFLNGAVASFVVFLVISVQSWFNALCMCLKIRCDGKSEKFYKIFGKLNRAMVLVSAGRYATEKDTDCSCYELGKQTNRPSRKRCSFCPFFSCGQCEAGRSIPFFSCGQCEAGRCRSVLLRLRGVRRPAKTRHAKLSNTP